MIVFGFTVKTPERSSGENEIRLRVGGEETRREGGSKEERRRRRRLREVTGEIHQDDL